MDTKKSKRDIKEKNEDDELEEKDWTASGGEKDPRY